MLPRIRAQSDKIKKKTTVQQEGQSGAGSDVPGTQARETGNVPLAQAV